VSLPGTDTIYNFMDYTDDKMKLLLTGLEAEVVEEALELYVRVRADPTDGRFEYRYRAAQSVLASLRQGNRDLETFPRGDDDDASPVDDPRPGRRPLRDRIED
jgi:hypothetical protein